MNTEKISHSHCYRQMSLKRQLLCYKGSEWGPLLRRGKKPALSLQKVIASGALEMHLLLQTYLDMCFVFENIIQCMNSSSPLSSFLKCLFSLKLLS